MRKLLQILIKEKQGQAILVSVVFFLFLSLGIVLTMVNPLTREVRSADASIRAKQSYYLTEAGTEDVMYRLKLGKEVSTEEVITLLGNQATTTITETGFDQRQIDTEGSIENNLRKIRSNVTITAGGGSFNFGVQAGNGGFRIRNSASVDGNIYSNGTVVGENSSVVTGGVASAGPTGLVDGIAAGADVYANTIQNSSVGGDAYYQNISATTVSGTSFPGSPNLATSSYPISDYQIEQWKQAAEAGGVINSPCPYVIDSDTNIGPVKINCDLSIEKNSTNVTLGGFIWVVGNIDFKNSPTIKLDPAFGDTGTAMIADNEANRLTSGKIDVANSTTFVNSGTEGSYIMLISQNNSVENSGTERAINARNSVNGDVLVYASHGYVEIHNSITLRQITGYFIEIRNSAVVSYVTGLASVLFNTGPSGSWSITDWREVE